MRVEKEIKTCYPSETYDAVIIGGGPNGLGIAALLGKAGLKVCVLEERLQCGGGAENVEPIPGFRIDPHATYFYAGASPTIEILELWKFGFRLKYFKTLAGTVTSDGKAIISGRFNIKNTIESIAKYSKKDAEFTKIMYENSEPYTKDFLRSIFWTPPYTPDMWSDPKDLPWFKFMKEKAPGLLALFPPETVMELSTYELLDMQYEFESLKVIAGQGAWYNGPFPAWRGMGIFGIATGLLMAYSSSSPQGGMHSYMHALIRCCLHYGVKIYTNAKVGEILVENGEAKGVVLADESFYPGKVICAERLVISAIDVKQTFLKLLKGKYIPKPQDAIEEIKPLKEWKWDKWSFFTLHFTSSKPPEFKADDRWVDKSFMTILGFDGLKDVLDFFRGLRENKITKIAGHMTCQSLFDDTLSRNGKFISFFQMCAPYDFDWERNKSEIENQVLKILKDFQDTTPEDFVSETPWDIETRFSSMVKGSIKHGDYTPTQMGYFRPSESCSSSRTPLKNLYLCGASTYPGGLIIGGPGYICANVIAEDIGLKKWWKEPDFLVKHKKTYLEK